MKTHSPGIRPSVVISTVALVSCAKPPFNTIEISPASNSRPTTSKRMEALVKPYRRQIQAETIDNKVLEKLVMQAFAETVVLGWENVEDRNGNLMEFNVANVIQLFTDLPDLFKDVQEQAQKAVLFREDILEVESKN